MGVNHTMVSRLAMVFEVVVGAINVCLEELLVADVLGAKGK